MFLRLLDVQAKLKAPKNQRNNFGNYNYRSAEDIIEAVKPLLKDNNLLMSISDSLEVVNGSTYVKATVRITDAEKGDRYIETSAYAREPIDKKGMSPEQITGSTSSYARKYALNGMFAIDDTKDADYLNTGDTKAPAKKAPIPTWKGKPIDALNRTEMIEAITAYYNGDIDAFDKLLKYYKKEGLNFFTEKELKSAVETLAKKGDWAK